MKKIFIPLFVIAALSITSCRKDRACTCTVTSSIVGGSTSTTGTEVHTMGHVTKREATSNCLSRKESQVSGTVTFEDVYDCKLN